ncbi:MAG: class I SAM-dependent methyltransferase, partial [Bacteroidales bacterium]|nr:class I SAM-dependent methyltransferase [Bacteroidales bacterium]
MKGKMTEECKLCGSDTKRIDHPTIAYRSCPNCEFVFKEDKYLVSKDEELEIYNTHNNSIEDPRCLEFFYNFLNTAVFPYASTGKEGLDFGSGSSPVLAKILETNHNYKMHIYDLFYSPEKVYKGKKYDLITSTEVVEH